MIGTFEIRCHAAKPQMPLPPMFAFKDSPSSLRLLEIPKKIGEWNITTVKVAVNYPDNTTNIYTASRNGNVWVVTFNGCSITGKVANGLEVLADGLDENGDAVNGYVLGVGDIYILDRDTDVEEAVSKHTMRYCDETPETPVGGDVVIENGALKVYDGTQWISVDIDLSEYATKSELETAASTLDSKIDSTKTELEGSISEVASDIPTKTSELTNDSGYITSTQVKPYNLIQGYANRAQGSLFLFGRISSQVPDENHYVTIDYNVGKLCYAGQSYYPWQLSIYDGTTFDPPLEMTYGYRLNVTYKYNGRIRSLYVNSNCWVAIQIVDARNTRPYYILAVENEHGSMIPDTNLYITGVAHPITFSTNNLSIETIDGVAGGITCTRQGTGTYATEFKYFLFEDQLPTKVSDLTNDAGYLTTVSWNDIQNKPDIPSKTSDLVNDSGFITSSDIPAIPTKTSDLTNDSGFTTTTYMDDGLALKQDKLSDVQISAIDSVVDERKTVVTYTDDTTATYNIVGELKHDQIYVDGKIPKTVRVGDGVTAIESNCFLGNTLLTSLTFGKDVAYLNAGCLSGTGLTSIVVPNKVKEIPDRTITHNSNLTELVLNEGLETLGIVPQNTRLATLKIPSTVTLINPNAFQYDTALTEVTFEGKTISQVQAMSNYPWGISDTNIIKTFNIASKEWVLEQLANL